MRGTPEGTRYWVQAGTHWGSRHEPLSRADLRISRYFPLSKGRITAFVEMLNVLGRENVRGYEYDLMGSSSGFYIERDAEYWFGRVPSFGVTYEVDL